ncbi:MAG: heme-binding domain-containing protein [Formosa sp.]|jgi:hypothetical protein|nr:heme-binding domain-containing protein [Formosa sp.]MDB2426637.1 heme-binding domain-containing protein [Flavobacteriaceae bacterium]MDC0462756.1 heme-binding domain-containing protein [Flavobacteriaceae bacterium]|tara:strand:- start:5038 stop:5517 length:480 start_codon:yes stop_codon:yes gene_type:complete
MNLKNKILVVLISLFMVSQFLSPKKNQSGLYAVNQFFLDTNTPKEVQILLKEACFDCHSDQTDYPWYNSITPINYWLNSHIKGGKKHFDVSKWFSYSDNRKVHKLEELVEEVKERKMPLKSYTWTHKSAVLDQNQINSLVNWANREILANNSINISIED